MDESSFRRTLGMAFTIAVAKLVVGVGAVTGPIVVYLMPWALMPDAPEAVRIAVGSLAGIGALYLCVFAACLIRAPYIQRNEARRERDEAKQERDVAREETSRVKSQRPMDAADIAAAQSRAAGVVRLRNQRP